MMGDVTVVQSIHSYQKSQDNHTPLEKSMMYDIDTKNRQTAEQHWQ